MSTPPAPTGRGANVPPTPACDLGSHIPEQEHGCLYPSNIDDNYLGPDINTKASIVYTPQSRGESLEIETETGCLDQPGTTRNAGHGHHRGGAGTGNSKENILAPDSGTDGIRIYPAPISGRYSVCPPLEESNPRVDLFSSQLELKNLGTTVGQDQTDHRVIIKKGRKWSGAEGSRLYASGGSCFDRGGRRGRMRLVSTVHFRTFEFTSSCSENETENEDNDSGNDEDNLPALVGRNMTLAAASVDNGKVPIPQGGHGKQSPVHDRTDHSSPSPAEDARGSSTTTKACL